MDKLLRYIALGLIGILLALGVYGYFQVRSYERHIVELQNQVAQRDSTIEVQKQVYTKLTAQFDDLSKVVDRSTAEGRSLAAELKKNKSELVSVTNALVKLREQVVQGQGTQVDVDGRKRVEFSQDFGYVSIGGHTLTDPPEYQLRLGPGSRPLRLQLAVAQQKDGSWRSYVVSSDENVIVDIGLTAVNPYVLEMRWYEKFQLHLDVGVGDGVLAGVGASYQIGRFQFGPNVWGTTTGGGEVFYGLNLSWSPFKR